MHFGREVLNTIIHVPSNIIIFHEPEINVLLRFIEKFRLLKAFHSSQYSIIACVNILQKTNKIAVNTCIQSTRIYV